MGCDFCVYLPDDGKYDCGMAYSTFNRVRTSIVALYLQKHNVDVFMTDEEDYGLTFAVVSQSLMEKVSDALDNMCTDEANSLKVVWEHSDCDGSYWSEDCVNIGAAIKSVLKMFDEEDPDKERAEALAEMFCYAGEKQGIVEVC